MEQRNTDTPTMGKWLGRTALGMACFGCAVLPGGGPKGMAQPGNPPHEARRNRVNAEGREPRTLEAVERRIAQTWSRYATVRARVATTMVGSGAVTDGAGTVEYSRVEGTEKHRIEMQVSQTGAGVTRLIEKLTIDDGNGVYHLTRFGGRTHAVKEPRGSLVEALGGEQVFRALRLTSDIELLPDERFKGEPAYAVKATVRSPGQNRIVVVRVTFSQATGAVLQTMGFNHLGDILSTTVHSDFEINPKIDPSRFVFTLPPGAQLIDHTRR